jgi:transposase
MYFYIAYIFISIDELKQRVKPTKSSRMGNRYLAITHFTEGQFRDNMTRYLKVVKGGVNSWIQKYLGLGIDGLNEVNHTGRPNKLTVQ